MLAHQAAQYTSFISKLIVPVFVRAGRRWRLRIIWLECDVGVFQWLTVQRDATVDWRNLRAALCRIRKLPSAARALPFAKQICILRVDSCSRSFPAGGSLNRSPPRQPVITRRQALVRSDAFGNSLEIAFGRLLVLDGETGGAKQPGARPISSNSMSSLMKRTDPSQKAKNPPPGCGLLNDSVHVSWDRLADNST